jgi:hypothetical protein
MTGQQLSKIAYIAFPPRLLGEVHVRRIQIATNEPRLGFGPCLLPLGFVTLRLGFLALSVGFVALVFGVKQSIL